MEVSTRRYVDVFACLTWPSQKLPLSPLIRFLLYYNRTICPYIYPPCPGSRVSFSSRYDAQYITETKHASYLALDILNLIIQDLNFEWRNWWLYGVYHLWSVRISITRTFVVVLCSNGIAIWLGESQMQIQNFTGNDGKVKRFWDWLPKARIHPLERTWWVCGRR